VVASFHTPADEESKRLPFEEAAAGAVALETFLPAAMRLYHGGHLRLPQLFRAMALNPANRLGLPQGRLAEGLRPIWCCSTPTRPSRWTVSPALEIEEHAVRRRADGGAGAGDLGRRQPGLRAEG
jgi:dihydroorotase-like cyclic amidohydrolase